MTVPPMAPGAPRGWWEWISAAADEQSVPAGPNQATIVGRTTTNHLLQTSLAQTDRSIMPLLKVHQVVTILAKNTYFLFLLFP
jgi:hypothetical protein